MISNHYRVLYIRQYSFFLFELSILCNVHIPLPVCHPLSFIYMYNFRFHVCAFPSPFFFIYIYIQKFTKLSLYFTCHEEEKTQRISRSVSILQRSFFSYFCIYISYAHTRREERKRTVTKKIHNLYILQQQDGMCFSPVVPYFFLNRNRKLAIIHIQHKFSQRLLI